jgi:hypothetical protein
VTPPPLDGACVPCAGMLCIGSVAVFGSDWVRSSSPAPANIDRDRCGNPVPAARGKFAQAGSLQAREVGLQITFLFY